MRWARHYTERQVVQIQSLLAGIARLVSEESSLERTLSRAAILLHDAIPFERLHVLRLDRTESVTLYVVRASGEVEVTGHLIGDAPSPSAEITDAAERSRLICTVRQGSRVKGAVWLTSSQSNAFTNEDQNLLEAVGDLIERQRDQIPNRFEQFLILVGEGVRLARSQPD